MATQVCNSDVLKYKTKLFNFAHMLTLDYEMSYQLLQDTLSSAMDLENEKSDVNKLKTSLYRLMRDIFIKNYKSGVVKQVETPGIEVKESDDKDASVNINVLYNKMSQLPKVEMQAYAMYARGYRYSEIAEKLQLSQMSVESCLANASRNIEPIFLQCG